jgi:radical SAM superfamily enzyme YgiQ (UPF0313 family)
LSTSDVFSIYFADLTHTGQGVNADLVPLGAGLIAAYVLQELPEVELELFKLPNILNERISAKMPNVICFSNYAWNEKLALQYAQYVKSISSSTVVIFGGPNFPIDTTERKQYLLSHSQIDFYIKWEGELATVELIRKLSENNFNVEAVKSMGLEIDNVCYSYRDSYVEGADGRVDNIDSMPSPYLGGLFDNFLKSDFIPLFETTRGCPYSCSFCSDGTSQKGNISRRSLRNIELDIEYAAQLSTVKSVFFSDDNFGMYKEDLDVAKLIASIIDKYDWPDRFETSTGKSQPARLIQSNEIINSVKPGVFKLGYSFQSTDSDVLKEIKRKNLSISSLKGMSDYFASRSSEKLEFFTELILALPGDTLCKFTRSLRDVVDDLLANNIDVHQLTLLKGSYMATQSHRNRYGLLPKYRVFVGCFGQYMLGDQQLSIFEMEEVILENVTFSYDDYVKARVLHLLVKIYVDHDPFIELVSFLRMKNISIIDVLVEIRDNVIQSDSKIASLISSFTRGMLDYVFDSPEELDEFVLQPNAIDKYISGEFGANELLVHRARAFLSCQDELYQLLYHGVITVLKKENVYSELYDKYVDESIRFRRLKNFNLRDYMVSKKGVFSFDFLQIQQEKFKVDPREVEMPGQEYEFKYSDENIARIKRIEDETKGNMKKIGKLYQRYNLMTINRELVVMGK